MNHPDYLIKLIRVRKRIIKQKAGFRSSLRCLGIIKSMELTINCYKHWTDKDWKIYFKRHYNEILYLIPGNQSRSHYIELLNGLLL